VRINQRRKQQRAENLKGAEKEQIPFFKFVLIAQTQQELL